jgi:hypothetical protein
MRTANELSLSLRERVRVRGNSPYELPLAYKPTTVHGKKASPRKQAGQWLNS